MVTGARRGELCALRWRHFDPHRRVLVIRASIGQVRTETWEKDTKLHQRRHVTLDERTCAMLTAYHQARQRRAPRRVRRSPRTASSSPHVGRSDRPALGYMDAGCAVNHSW